MDITNSTNYCQVRFLNAAQNYFPLLIAIGPRLISSRLSYTEITPYYKVAGSYCPVTIAEASNPLNVLLRQYILFGEGEQITLAITPTTQGLQLINVSDQDCSNKEYNTGCIRFVNLSYGSIRLDVKLENKETVFKDIEFTEITPYKTANAGKYVFSVFQYIPSIQPRNVNEPVLVFPLEIGGLETITVYLVGEIYMANGLQSVIVYNE